MKWLSTVLVLVLMFTLLVAGPVLAGPPVIEISDFTEDEPVFDPSPCDFEVWNHEVGSIRQTSYFDNQGNLIRIKLHISGTDSLYNPENPDVILSGFFNGNAEVDLETGELVLASGVPWHITAPGYGTVLVRAGRWMRYPDSQVAGKNSFLISTDIEQLCAALSGVPISSANSTVAASKPHSFLFLPTIIGNTQQ